MKILLAPAKTMNTGKESTGQMPVFAEESKRILEELKKLNEDDLAKTMKIKGKILDSTALNIKNYENNLSAKAIESYEGMVYKNLDFQSLKNKDYIESSLFILDAFYGILRPSDLIKPYRLDFKADLKGFDLYDFWKSKINTFLFEELSDELIVSLASKEFIKLIDLPYVEIEFRVLKDGKYKNVATFAKMARGRCLRAMAENSVKSIEDLKKLSFDGYNFSRELSDKKKIIFAKS